MTEDDNLFREDDYEFMVLNGDGISLWFEYLPTIHKIPLILCIHFQHHSVLDFFPKCHPTKSPLCAVRVRLLKELMTKQIMNQERVYYRFVNQADAPASVYWVSHRSKRKLYCTLNPKQFIDVNTFSGHCWIFEDAKNGDCLLADGSCIFTPTKWREFLMKSVMKNHTRLSRKVLTISRPCHTLKGLSYRAICDSDMSIKDAQELLLPRELKDELVHLLKRRDCIVRHTNGCENCPFDLHKAHLHHKCNMSACLNLLKANSSGRLVRLPHGRLTCIPGSLKS